MTNAHELGRILWWCWWEENQIRSVRMCGGKFWLYTQALWLFQKKFLNSVLRLIICFMSSHHPYGKYLCNNDIESILKCSIDTHEVSLIKAFLFITLLVKRHSRKKINQTHWSVIICTLSSWMLCLHCSWKNNMKTLVAIKNEFIVLKLLRKPVDMSHAGWWFNSLI